MLSGMGRNPKPLPGHTPNMWAYDFAMYKQDPKGASKMKILSRNFISVSLAQKVPARISKQLPPSNTEINHSSIRSQPRRKRWWPRTISPSFLSRAAPGGSTGWAAQPTLPLPRCCQAALGQQNWSNWTGEALPQRLRLANRQQHWVIDKIWEQG